MSHIHLPKEWIPQLQIGDHLYTHYPIQELSRPEAERILKCPAYHRHIILRTSNNARKMSPDLYYVATYFVSGRNESINQIVTRTLHSSMDGKLHRILSYPDTYSLVIQSHLPIFMKTTRIDLSAPALAPIPAPDTDVKSVNECITTTE